MNNNKKKSHTNICLKIVQIVLLWLRYLQLLGGAGRYSVFFLLGSRITSEINSKNKKKTQKNTKKTQKNTKKHKKTQKKKKHKKKKKKKKKNSTIKMSLTRNLTTCWGDLSSGKFHKMNECAEITSQKSAH